MKQEDIFYEAAAISSYLVYAFALLHRSYLHMFNGSALAQSASPKVLELKNEIFAYANTNEESLRSQMEEIEQWFENHHLLFKQDGQLLGIEKERPYSKELISDPDIVNYFSENEFVTGISHPVNSDVITFCVGGFGNVTSGISLGFYHSPDDSPKWIDSEQLRPYGLDTGEYMNYPMLPDGDDWIPDKALIAPDNDPDDLLRSYVLYTERICEHFFYYESSY